MSLLVCPNDFFFFCVCVCVWGGGGGGGAGGGEIAVWPFWGKKLFFWLFDCSVLIVVATNKTDCVKVQHIYLNLMIQTDRRVARRAVEMSL